MDGRVEKSKEEISSSKRSMMMMIMIMMVMIMINNNRHQDKSHCHVEHKRINKVNYPVISTTVPLNLPPMSYVVDFSPLCVTVSSTVLTSSSPLIPIPKTAAKHQH